MKPRLKSFLAAAIFAALTAGVAVAQIPAFPGAQGFGAYATGGRGGDVYTVTNLSGTGVGSLRYGIENAPTAGRTIVFAVSGYIPIANNSDTGNKTIRIVKNKITIAGQTAPGDGIGLKDGRLLVTGDESVIRHLRIRHGKNGSSGDCINIESSANNTMIDHVSLMFSTDENISFFNSAVNNFTLQYSTSSWGMERHNAGGLWDLQNGTSHHTLWAHHRTRNPKARPNGLLEWINNVTFHWRNEGFIMGDSTSNQTWRANVRGCYYLSIADEDFGLNQTALSKALIAENGQPNFNLYLDNTLTDSNDDGVLNGTDKGYSIVAGQPYNASEGAAVGANRYGKSSTPFSGSSGAATVTIDPPLTAYKKVIASSGALRLDVGFSGPLRDELDSLLIKSVEDQDSILVAKDTPVDGDDPPSNGEAQLAAAPYNITNSGFGTLNSTTAPNDSDGDGMPNDYESALGWNPSAQDHNTALPNSGGIVTAPTFMPVNTPSGYTRLEEYLHFKSIPHALISANGTLTVDLRRYTRGFNKSPMTFAFSNVSNGTVTLQANGYTAVFTPTANYSGRARFDFTVTDGDGSTWKQTLGVLVKPGTVTIPSAPTGLSAAAGNFQISLNWAATSGATSYNVKRATTSGGPFTTVASPTTNSYVNNGLSNGTAYFYVVSAVNSAGQSGDSAQVSATPDANAPTTIQAEAGTITGGTIDSDNPGFNGTGFVNLAASAASIQFNNVNGDGGGGGGGAATLVVRFALGAAASRTGNLVVNGVTQAITFPTTGAWTTWTTLSVPITLSSGTTNTLRFETTGADLANVDEITVTPSAGPAVPPAPTGLATTASSTQVSLSWSASSGATSYNVKRATTSGGPYTTVSSPTTNSYVDTGLANGTTYYYVVSTVNAVGEGANSSQASATPQPPAPAAPTGLTATASSTQVSLSWTASSDATSYNIKRSTTSGSGYAMVSTTSGTSFTNTGLTNGTTYYYVVTAINGGGESANSTQASATPQPPAPAAPTGLGATAGNTQVSLSWTASSSATSYHVKRATTSGGPYTTVSSPTGTSYVNTGLTNGTTYYYVVSAINGGGESADSSQASATPQPPAPAAPTGLAAIAGNGQVSLTWNTSSGATSYNVKRATTSGGPYTTVASPTTNSYVNTGLTNGTAYYYVVSAVNAGGESANSTQASASPQPPILSGLLIYEGFGYTSGASITNQTGGFGWGANWSNTGNPQDVSAAQAASLASGTLLTSGGAVKFGPSSAGGSTSSGVYMRQFSSTLGSIAAAGAGTLWLSMLYLNSTNSVDASGFYGEARIGLYSGVTAVGGVTQTAGGTNVLNTGTLATSPTVADRISLYLGSTISATTVATPRSTTPAFLLLKIVADNTTANDTVYLWVNPNLANGEPSTATANASWTTANLSAVNGLRFQQAGTNGGVVDTIDEIRLGRTFGDVTASSALPSPWATADIGSVAAAGRAGHSAGVFTVVGSGAGITGTADEFRTVHQNASGDCSIVARVSALQNTSANAKAGVSIRETTGDTAAQATCAVSNGSVSFIYRSATGAASTTIPVSGLNPPLWVRMERVGGTFTASHSADGVNWTPVGTTTITMATTTTLGTSVTSQADGTLTNASIDQVIATP